MRRRNRRDIFNWFWRRRVPSSSNVSVSFAEEEVANGLHDFDAAATNRTKGFQVLGAIDEPCVVDRFRIVLITRHQSAKVFSFRLHSRGSSSAMFAGGIFDDDRQLCQTTGAFDMVRLRSSALPEVEMRKVRREPGPLALRRVLDIAVEARIVDAVAVPVADDRRVVAVAEDEGAIASVGQAFVVRVDVPEAG